MATPKQEPQKKQGKPVFVGKSALVRLVNGTDINTATIWLVDPSNKTLRPFVSEEQFDSMFDNAKQARSAIVTLQTDELSPGGVLGDFKVLDSNYGIKGDGSMKKVEFSPSQLQGRYGQPMNMDGETKSVGVLDSLLGSLGGQESPVGDVPGGVPVSPTGVSDQPPVDPNQMAGGYGGKGGVGSGTVYDKYSYYPYKGVGGPNLPMYNTGISGRNTSNETEAQREVFGVMDAASGNTLTQSFISELKGNPDLLAFYIGALTYGSYQIGDVVNDMVRRQKVEAGDTSLSNVALISPTQTRQVYMTTDDGKKASSVANTILPSGSMMSIGSYDTLKNYTIYNMPDNFYKELVPTLDATNPNFKNEVDDVKSAYYDIMSDIASAETEQERTIAKNNLETLQKQIQDQYGFQLSDNVNTAWTQLNNIQDTASTRGIKGSGIENEEIDDYLTQVRTKNDQIRKTTLNSADAAKQTYYQTKASPAEIAALTPEERQKYGLVPPDSSLSVASLLQQFPYLTQDEAQKYHDSMVDEYGNYRSDAYKALTKTQQENTASEFAGKQGILEQQQLDKDAKERRMWDSADPNAMFDKPDESGQSGYSSGENQDIVKEPIIEGTSGSQGLSTSDQAAFDKVTKNLQDAGYVKDSSGNWVLKNAPTSNLSTNLTPGSTSSAVSALQDYLRDQGYFPKTQQSTGYYGDVTRNAVAAWQKANGLDAGTDAGYWGPKSIALMNSLTSTIKTGTQQTSVPVTTQQTTIPLATTQTQPAKTNPVVNTSSITSAINNIQNSLSGNTSTTTKQTNTTPAVTGPIMSKAPTVTQTPTQTPAATKPSGYAGGSIVDYLSSLGQDSSFTSRSKTAQSKGIANYTGTAEQNTQLLKALRGY